VAGASFTVGQDINHGRFGSRVVRWIGRGPFDILRGEEWLAVKLLTGLPGFQWVEKPDRADVEAQRAAMAVTFPGGSEALPPIPRDL